MKIENGAQASLALKVLVEWMDNADETELAKVKAYVDELVVKAEKPEAYLYSSFWAYLTDKGA